MLRLSRDEYDATYRIFNHVEDVVGPYYGRKTRQQIEGFASLNRWIMFPKNGIDSLREGTVYPFPNVFVSTEDEIKDDGTGKVDGWLGFTYHNVEAMLSFYEMLRRNSQSLLLMNIFGNLGEGWSLEIQQKTKTDYQDSTPKYDTFMAFSPSEIIAKGMDQIKAAIKASNQNLLQYGQEYPQTGNPVLWSVTIFTAMKETSTVSFDIDIKKAFDAFFQLPGIL